MTNPKRIAYKAGYKYQLTSDHKEETGIEIPKDVETDYIVMTKKGLLVIKKGYAWDGPSGPTIDTKDFMRGSLVHDALYQLMRMEEIPHNYQMAADQTLKSMCIEDGMWRIRAAWVYLAVRRFGKSSTDPSNRKKMSFAP